ncbi:MAG: ABC transporter permease [Chloroflexi bacterium]|nr:ABC transporter permease [Chloroflexota bacterium]
MAAGTVIQSRRIDVLALWRSRSGGVLTYFSRNASLSAGAILLLVLLLICLVGPLFVNVDHARATSVLPDQAPSLQFPLGTDDQGRDLAAVLVAGLPLTLRIGFIAGGVGLGIGILLGLLAGYRGGVFDIAVRMIVDTLLTVPGLLVLIIIADSIKGVLSINSMALIVASLAWMQPTRTIRAQVLTLRERAYVQVARLNGMGTLAIIVRELLPNLLPYVAASFVGAVGSAVLASIGLEALGLGPQDAPDIGMTIYWAITFNALLRGLWWWWTTPIIAVMTLFIGLFLVSSGLDAIANPRLRRHP